LRFILRFLRSLLIWLGPVLVLLLAVVAGFGFWVVKSEPGTRWALDLGVGLAGGQVERVQGSLWDGLTVGHIVLDTPAAKVDVRDLELNVDWPALRQRRLHARNLSVGDLTVNVMESDQPASDEPFTLPALPVTLALDRFYLGKLNVSLNNEPILFDVRDLEASLAVSKDDAQLVFRKLELGQQDIEANVRGELRLLALADPWPFSAWIETDAKTAKPDSLLCLRHFLPELPTVATEPASDTGSAGADSKETASAGSGSNSGSATELDAVSTFCAVDLRAEAEGSMQEASITLSGDGQDVQLQAAAKLHPQQAFPLHSANWSLVLGDGSSLKGNIDWAADAQGGVNPDHLIGQVALQRLNLGLVLPEALPQASLTAQLDFDVQLRNASRFESAAVKLAIDSGSSWNGQPLDGRLDFSAKNNDKADALVPAPEWVEIQNLDLALRLGANQVSAKGGLGFQLSALSLDLDAPRLADFWPDLEGSAGLKARLEGNMAKHQLSLQARYDAGAQGGDKLGQAPIALQTDLRGGWQAHEQDPAQGVWSGQLASLAVEHAGITVATERPMTMQVAPDAVSPAYLLTLGDTAINIALPSRNNVIITHRQTRFSPGRWSTQGEIARLTLSRRLIDEVMNLVGEQLPEDAPGQERGRVIVDVDDRNDMVDMTYGLNWDLAFEGALSGKAQIRRLGGDMIVPGDPPFPLGLRTLQADIAATPTSGGASRIDVDLNVETQNMGQAQVQVETLLRATPEGGFAYNPDDGTTVRVQAAMENIGWLSLFVGDATEIGGALQANLTARSRPGGEWAMQGQVQGSDIRFIRIDDGVRLVEGTLDGHFEEDRFVLDRLEFPAVRRAVPKEWRTETWTRENPDAQGGKLTLSGYWDVSDSAGQVAVDLYRYPILQRSDRFAMVTGKLNVGIPSPALNIDGELNVDAGWIDLDMLSSVPTLDSDVVVIRPGQEQAASSPLDITLNISIDLGPRFYITGYGVDSGLVGEMRIVMAPQGRPMAYGVLRTRGGAIEAYGQRLQLRRGTITFQGPIASPILNIEALRTGVAVEAGVRVSGTARKPQINLISYPDVADVQKLSWLLLGRGPDDSGGDAALLFSVGTSFLGDGEPFYKKFGLDEVSMRSGELGSVGSILPAQTVVRGLDSGTSEIERQFVVAAKHLTDDITLSLEQALTDTGTVGRVSYHLARGLSAQLSAGTVSGLALVWRAFSSD
jgi:translocation and assembly module TamB|tara:strand:+ start:25448 stop:29080 length:3633 start_codon:yes stop_codon:yes gene_type:complete